MGPVGSRRLSSPAGSTGLRIFVDGAEAVGSVHSVLTRARADRIKGGRGPIYFCLMDPSLPGETEIDLGEEFTVNPQIKGAIRSLPGVVEVEEV